MIKPIVVLIFSLIIIEDVFAQCSVTKTNLKNDTVAYEAQLEEVYKNKDFENSLQSVYAGLFLFHKLSIPQKANHQLKVYTSTMWKKEIPPRQLIFSLSNGDFIN